jgi:O-antigen/teichoic acid export membrane protein
MSFRSLIAYNTLVQIVGKALGVAFSLGTVILLTRYLGIAGFGQYSTALAFVGFFVILADLGIYEITVREVAQKKEKNVKILSNVYVYRIFSSFLIFAVAFLISLLMPYEPIVKLAIGIVALQSLFTSLTTFLCTIFQVNYRMDLPTFIEVLSRALYFVLIYLAIQHNFNLLGIFWFFVITNFINFLLIYLLSLKFIKLKSRLDWKFLQYFLKESLPLGLVAILIMINYTIGTILLSLSKPMADVGIYGSAYRVFENLAIIPFIFTDLILPKISELYKTDYSRYKKFFQKAFNVLLVVVFPITILFFFLAPYCIYIIAGKEFIIAYHPLRILILALFAVFLTAPFIQFLIAGGKQKWLILNTFLITGFNIALNLILIPRYSYNGVALTTLVTEIVALFVLFWLTNYIFKIKPHLDLAQKLILPSSIMILFLYFLLRASFFSLERFSQTSLTEQIVLVVLISTGTGGLYSLILFWLKIVPLDFIKTLIFQRKTKNQPWPF